MNSGFSVLIVDDEKMVRDAVSAYLQKMGCDILEADNGLDALHIFKSKKADFVILDLMLPGMSGEEVCRLIRQDSKVPIIMLTAKTQEESVLAGLRIGADDYVTKPFSVKELYARMEAVLRRTAGIGFGGELHTFEGGLSINFEHCEAKKGESLIGLTRSEWKILMSMASHPKKVFTRDELMDIVFGDDTDSLDRAIDTHIKNLRKKIEDDPRNPVYIITVHGLGYKFGGDRII